MTMRANDRLVDIRNSIKEGLNPRRHFRWGRITNRVRNIDRRRSRVDRRLDDFAEKIDFRGTRPQEKTRRRRNNPWRVSRRRPRVR